MLCAFCLYLETANGACVHERGLEPNRVCVVTVNVVVLVCVLRGAHLYGGILHDLLTHANTRSRSRARTRYQCISIYTDKHTTNAIYALRHMRALMIHTRRCDTQIRRTCIGIAQYWCSIYSVAFRVRAVIKSNSEDRARTLHHCPDMGHEHSPVSIQYTLKHTRTHQPQFHED